MHFCSPVAAFCSFPEHGGTDGATVAVVFVTPSRVSEAPSVWHNDIRLADLDLPFPVDVGAATAAAAMASPEAE